MTTRKREVILQGGNTDPEQDNNWNALTGDGLVTGFIVHEETGVNIGSLADGAGATQSITVNGVELGDMVIGVSFGVDVEDMTITADVQSSDTVEVRVQNESTSTVDLASTTVRLMIATVN